MKIRLIACVLSALLAHSASAEFEGKVVAVIDGDTVDVLVDRSPIRVRLASIDAPEKRQAFGQRAKQWLSDKTFGKNIFVRSEKKDRYGREIGELHLNRENVNLNMVRDGFAWAYTQYTNDQNYFAAQREAQEKKRGLWVDAHAQAPWEFRKQQRKN